TTSFLYSGGGGAGGQGGDGGRGGCGGGGAGGPSIGLFTVGSTITESGLSYGTAPGGNAGAACSTGGGNPGAPGVQMDVVRM
ncbi:MAG: hypothetical protein K1X94_34900, partial [Sandaracinaceae bacterium]|nr:hypothetical protein [Sandaracinaceae bacterium]